MKILILCLTLLSSIFYSQISTLTINNYSTYYLQVRLGANGPSGTCLPSVISGIQVPPGTSLSPFTVTYDKFANSGLSAVPIDSWFVTTSFTSPGIMRPYNHPALNPSGPIALNTDWSYFVFQTFDGGSVTYDHFQLGVGNCNGTHYTAQSGTYSDAEWFTITSGGTVTTYVQIY